MIMWHQRFIINSFLTPFFQVHHIVAWWIEATGTFITGNLMISEKNTQLLFTIQDLMIAENMSSTSTFT